MEQLFQVWSETVVKHKGHDGKAWVAMAHAVSIVAMYFDIQSIQKAIGVAKEDEASATAKSAGIAYGKDLGVSWNTGFVPLEWVLSFGSAKTETSETTFTEKPDESSTENVCEAEQYPSSKKYPDYFFFDTGCTTEQKLKTAYRKWCKELHPDVGGNIKEFKRMQMEYNAFLYYNKAGGTETDYRAFVEYMTITDRRD